MSDCNCEDIIIEVSEEGIDGNGIVSISLQSTSGLQKTYRISFTNGTYFDYIVTDGSSIASIAKTATNVLTDVYTITLTSGETTSFQVTNGRGITKIEKTGTSGSLTDVYTISFNDGTTMTYNVKNGRGITSIYKTGSSGLQDTYTILFNDGTTTEYTVMNGAKGDTGNGIASITKTSSSGLNDVYTISFTNGTSTTFTVKNGRGVATVTKTGSSGLVDTYRMSFNDSTYVDFTVTNGEKGDSATIAVGTVTTGAEGSNATVTNVGTAYDAIFNFSIPRGNTGNGIQSITLLSTSGLDKTYRILMTDNTHFDFVVHDGNGIASITKTGSTGAVDHYRVSFTDTTYFDYDVTNGSDTWGAIVGTLSDQTDLQQALDNKAPVITETASGDIVSISDGAPMPVSALSVSVEPVQDLHGYDNPWPAGGGKNLADFDKTFPIANSSVVITDFGADKTFDAVTITLFCTNVVYANAGNTVIKLRTSDNTDIDIATNTFGMSANTTLNGTFSVTKTNVTFQKVFWIYYSDFTSGTMKIQVESGSSATSYAPYENTCPITGHSSATVTRTGICIWDGQTVNNGFYNVSGQWASENCISSKNPILVKPNTSYYMKCPSGYTMYATYWTKPVQAGTSAQSYFISRTSVANVAVTTPENCYAMHFNLGSSYGTTYNNDVSVNYPSTDTAYHTPHAQTVSIALGQTVYGATVYPLEGKMVVDREKYTFNGTESGWAKSGTRTGSFYFNTNTRHNASAKNICSHAQYTAFLSGYTVGKFYLDGNGLTMINVWLTEENWTVDQWKTYLAAQNTAGTPLEVVVELETPIVITGLTPAILRTLLGYNAIWADCGAVVVQYRADSKLYIERRLDERTTAVKAIITTTTDKMVAPKNLVSGDIIIVNDDLYKATANIASGATLTVGTNVTKVTLAEWIASLL